jgi:hypothetical protein
MFTFAFLLCPSGGIGRRARLKLVFHWSAGSTPASGTTKDLRLISRVFFIRNKIHLKTFCQLDFNILIDKPIEKLYVMGFAFLSFIMYPFVDTFNDFCSS